MLLYFNQFWTVIGVCWIFVWVYLGYWLSQYLGVNLFFFFENITDNSNLDAVKDVDCCEPTSKFKYYYESWGNSSKKMSKVIIKTSNNNNYLVNSNIYNYTQQENILLDYDPKKIKAFQFKKNNTLIEVYRIINKYAGYNYNLIECADFMKQHKFLNIVEERQKLFEQAQEAHRVRMSLGGFYNKWRTGSPEAYERNFILESSLKYKATIKERYDEIFEDSSNITLDELIQYEQLLRNHRTFRHFR